MGGGAGLADRKPRAPHRSDDRRRLSVEWKRTFGSLRKRTALLISSCLELMVDDGPTAKVRWTAARNPHSLMVDSG